MLKVGKNVYVAIGYGLANSIMLEGDEGVIIIDTLESCEVAREVRAAFEEVRVKSMGWGGEVAEVAQNATSIHL